MKWLISILCVFTIAIWGAIIWTYAGVKATDVTVASHHYNINSELNKKVRVFNYFDTIESKQYANHSQDGSKEEERQQDKLTTSLEQHIGYINPNRALSIDVVLEALNIQTQ